MGRHSAVPACIAARSSSACTPAAGSQRCRICTDCARAAAHLACCARRRQWRTAAGSSGCLAWPGQPGPPAGAAPPQNRPPAACACAGRAPPPAAWRQGRPRGSRRALPHLPPSAGWAGAAGRAAAPPPLPQAWAPPQMVPTAAGRLLLRPRLLGRRCQNHLQTAGSHGWCARRLSRSAGWPRGGGVRRHAVSQRGLATPRLGTAHSTAAAAPINKPAGSCSSSTHLLEGLGAGCRARGAPRLGVAYAARRGRRGMPLRLARLQQQAARWGARVCMAAGRAQPSLAAAGWQPMPWPSMASRHAPAAGCPCAPLSRHPKAAVQAPREHPP